MSQHWERDNTAQLPSSPQWPQLAVASLSPVSSSLPSPCNLPSLHYHPLSVPWASAHNPPPTNDPPSSVLRAWPRVQPCTPSPTLTGKRTPRNPSCVPASPAHPHHPAKLLKLRAASGALVESPAPMGFQATWVLSRCFGRGCVWLICLGPSTLLGPGLPALPR